MGTKLKFIKKKVTAVESMRTVWTLNNKITLFNKLTLYNKLCFSYLFDREAQTQRNHKWITSSGNIMMVKMN